MRDFDKLMYSNFPNTVHCKTELEFNATVPGWCSYARNLPALSHLSDSGITIIQNVL